MRKLCLFFKDTNFLLFEKKYCFTQPQAFLCIITINILNLTLK